MGLETATYINGLVTTNPVGSDDRSTADDHLRLIKSVLKNSFTGISGAVTATHGELDKLAGHVGAVPQLGIAQSWSGKQTFDAGILLPDNDQIEFGTAGAESQLYSDGINTIWNFLANTDLRIDDGVAAVSRYLFDISTGDFHADGDVIAFSTSVGSDPKLKKDIEQIKDARAKLRGLTGVTFKWKKNDQPSAGLLSTDVEKVLPEAVSIAKKLKKKEHQVVNYNAVIGLLVEAVNAMDAELRTLKRRMNHLHGEKE